MKVNFRVSQSRTILIKIKITSLALHYKVLEVILNNKRKNYPLKQPIPSLEHLSMRERGEDKHKERI